MKRTLLVLSTLVTIILMSCGYLENSISSAEDVNKPQALKLASQDDMTMEEVTQSSASNSIMAISSSSWTSNQSLGVTMNVGTTVTSPNVPFNLPGTLPKTAVLTNVQVKIGTSTSNVGAISVIDGLIIKKGTSGLADTIPWTGVGNTTLQTSKFNGEPARDDYTILVRAKCLTGGIVLGTSVNYCSWVYDKSKTNLILTYDTL